jgi:hypothetical protein
MLKTPEVTPKLTTALDNNTFTGFKTMVESLENMLKLTVLDMQLPYVEEFNMSQMNIQLLLNLDMGKRGAQLLAQNLKNLT